MVDFNKIKEECVAFASKVATEAKGLYRECVKRGSFLGKKVEDLTRKAVATTERVLNDPNFERELNKINHEILRVASSVGMVASGIIALTGFLTLNVPVFVLGGLLAVGFYHVYRINENLKELTDNPGRATWIAVSALCDPKVRTDAIFKGTLLQYLPDNIKNPLAKHIFNDSVRFV